MNLSPLNRIFSPQRTQNTSFCGTRVMQQSLKTDTFERAAVDKLTKDCIQYTKYQKAKPYIVENFHNDIMNLATGRKTECTYVTLPGDEFDYKRIAIANNKVVGFAEMKLSPYAGREKPTTWPDSQDMDTHQIVYLSTAPGYRGVGTDLIKGAIMDSIASGKDGRLLIKAMPEGLPSKYKELCGSRIEKSPVPFYYKLGFRFIKSTDNEKTQDALKAMSTTGRYSQSAPRVGFMYLKESDAWRLLDPRNNFSAVS